MSALPQFSDVDLLGYGKRVIDLDSQIANCAPDTDDATDEPQSLNLPARVVRDVHRGIATFTG